MLSYLGLLLSMAYYHENNIHGDFIPGFFHLLPITRSRNFGHESTLIQQAFPREILNSSSVTNLKNNASKFPKEPLELALLVKTDHRTGFRK